MKVKILDVEIRGSEIKNSKKDDKPYILVRYEDSTGQSHEIVDRDMAHEGVYKRGVQGEIVADLRMGRTKEGKDYASLSLLAFEPAAN